MRILLTGRNGQVGNELGRALPALGDVIATDRGGLDLTHPDAIRRFVREARPQIIVNAAAYTAVDKAESEHELATRDGRYTTADAADTNVVAVLNKLGRHEEALARSDAILARMAGSDSGNAAYAWLGHLSALVSLRRFAAFRAAAPRAASIMRKNGVPQITPLYAMVLAEEGRAHDAVRMIGYARRAFELCGMALDRTPQGKLDAAGRIARTRLDQATFDALVAQGRLLDDAAADRLALGEAAVPARN